MEECWFKGNPVLSSAAIQEISNLKKHIEKGCLSGIRPGRGTNRNENLHKSINSIMTSSRYGIELAYALLATCFHQHNIKRGLHKFQNVLVHEMASQTDSEEKFGLVRLNSREPGSSLSKSNRGTLSIDKSVSCYLVVERLTARNDEYMLTDLDESEKLLPTEEVTLEDHDVSIHTLKHILLRALLWYYSHAYIKKYTNTAILPIRCIPFMNSNIDKLHMLLLINVLSAWNFHRI